MGQQFKEEIMPLVHEHCVKVASHISGLSDPMGSKINKSVRYLLQETDELKKVRRFNDLCLSGVPGQVESTCKDKVDAEVLDAEQDSPAHHEQDILSQPPPKVADPSCHEFLIMALAATKKGSLP